MTNAPKPQSNEPAHDPEVLELAQKIFGLARHGDTDTVAAYVDAGVPVNLTNDDGDPVLMLAACNGHADVVRVLLDRGADPDKPDGKGRMPIAGAVTAGEDEVVRVLLEGGANPRAGEPSAVETARESGKKEFLELFGERA